MSKMTCGYVGAITGQKKVLFTEIENQEDDQLGNSKGRWENDQFNLGPNFNGPVKHPNVDYLELREDA